VVHIYQRKGVFSDRRQALREAWKSKYTHKKLNRIRNSQDEWEREEYLLYGVLNDIEISSDGFLFVVKNVAWLPEDREIVEALVPGLRVYTWSGTIGRDGVNEELAKIAEDIRTYPENRFLIWGPGSEEILILLDYPETGVRVYSGG